MKDGRKITGFSSCILSVGFVALLTLFDQFTKYLAIMFLKNQPSVTLVNGVLELHYLENRGMAFGLMQGKIPVFLILCLVFFAAAIYTILRVPKERYFIPLILTVLLLSSGALGNFIDRAFRGYVVDFLYISLVDFPVFNVADIFVVCSCILLVLLICFKYKEEDLRFFDPRYKG